MKEIFENWILINRKRILENFSNLLEINTTSPDEALAYPFLKNYFHDINFQTEKQFFQEDLKNHPLFTNPPTYKATKDRFNIKVINKSKAEPGSKKVLFNVHIDVVPETGDFPNAFNPNFKDGYIIARGACDTKNNIIMIAEAIRFLKENNIKIQKEVEIVLAIEEEISGNGTLSSILHGVNSDLVIVMEPTSLLVYRGHRGCITATIEINGKSVHMGSDETGINAIECSYYTMNSLKELELQMLKEANNNKDFSIWKKPLQINFGKIFGGDWPGSVAERCTLVSNIGFLPDYSLDEMKNIITNTCLGTKDDWTNKNTMVKFDGLQNDAYIIDSTDDNIKAILDSLNKNGVDQKESYGWRVSCDAYLYHKLLKVPTIIFGSGDLSNAHSAHEKVALREIEKGILIMADYLSRP